MPRTPSEDPPDPRSSTAPTSATAKTTWTLPTKAQAVATLKTLISATSAKKSVELSMMMFGKPQPVIVNGADDRPLAIKFEGSTAGIDLLCENILWENITFSELASLGRAGVNGRAAQALTVGEACIGLGQKPIAEEMLHLAARLDPTFISAVAERLSVISPR